MQHETRTPARKVAVNPNHGLPAGVLGPVALIGPHLLEKEAAVGVRAKNGAAAQSLPASLVNQETKGITNRKTDV